MQLSVRTDRTLLRSRARSVRHLLVSLRAPHAPPRDARIPVSIAIVLDRSGSMDGADKFTLAREAVEMSLRMLRPEDRFTLVVFDTEIDLLVPLTAASPEAVRLAMGRLDAVGPRGGTDLHGGWAAGAGQLAARLSAESVSRALLLTDGHANHGVTDHDALRAFASELRTRGIVTTTFGVGADFDERLLGDIAHEGGGHFYYVETSRQIRDLLTSELDEALEVVLPDATLHVTLPAGATAEPLNRHRFTHARGDNELLVELGDLVSGQEQDVVLRIRFADADVGESATVRVGIGRGGSLELLAQAEQQWTYADHAANDRQQRDVVVDRAAATLYAARARHEAADANRRGDHEHARHVLEQTAKRIRSCANGDPELVRLARALRDETVMYAERVMSPMELKMSYMVAESSVKGRTMEGRARRGPRGA